MKFEDINRHFAVARHSSLLRNTFWFVCLNFLVFIRPLAAQTYSPPPNSRQDINLDANWRFIQSDAGTNAANIGSMIRPGRTLICRTLGTLPTDRMAPARLTTKASAGIEITLPWRAPTQDFISF
jgi:hypothetical protein